MLKSSPFEVVLITKKIIRWISRILLWTVFCYAYPVNVLANEPEGLDKLSIEELMGSKVISATRTEQQLTDTAAAAYVITQDDIRRSGATNIPEALRMVPGLHVARISSTKWAISARGFNGLVADKLLVLMDGRSLYSPINKGVYWDIQDRVLDDIERIEVIRGPGASVWGANAANGVINIITKHSADTMEGSATLFGGDKYGAGLRKGWQFDDQGYARVYGKFLRDESFANRIGNDANEEWTSGRGGFRMDWANSDGKHALMAQGDIYYGVYNQNDAKNQDIPSNDFSLNRTVKKGGNIMARWNYNQSLASRMTAQFFYDAFQENQSLNRSVNSETVDFDFQHVLAVNEAHELTWGFNYRLSLVQLKPFNSGIAKEYFPKTFQNNRFSVFFQDKWRWHDDVEITLGSKFEHHNNNGFEYEPSLRILWKAANQHRVWAGVSRSVRLPAVTDLSANVFFENDPNLKQVFEFNQYQKLKSDEVVSYELGYRYWNSDSFSFDVAAYYNQYNNNLVANNEFSDLFPEQSIKKSTTLGLEAVVAWHPVDWARFQLSTSFINMEIKSIRKIPNVSPETTSQDPRFLWAFRSSFDIAPAVEVDFWLRYADSASGVLVAQAIPSYVTLDARLAWKPNKNLELAFIANNLNDSQHPEFYDGFTPNPLQAERMFWLQGSLKY
ncbi:TonB-dependent receptor [Methyloglobulus sp.]|uniref:TonB-dependent receptor plug domain-containing protein n=1 Tax=Methyloglobulus sp. TaxID=2518622 RepID=UPI0032B82A33